MSEMQTKPAHPALLESFIQEGQRPAVNATRRSVHVTQHVEGCNIGATGCKRAPSQSGCSMTCCMLAKKDAWSGPVLPCQPTWGSMSASQPEDGTNVKKGDTSMAAATLMNRAAAAGHVALKVALRLLAGLLGWGLASSSLEGKNASAGRREDDGLDGGVITSANQSGTCITLEVVHGMVCICYPCSSEPADNALWQLCT